MSDNDTKLSENSTLISNDITELKKKMLNDLSVDESKHIELIKNDDLFSKYVEINLLKQTKEIENLRNKNLDKLNNLIDKCLKSNKLNENTLDTIFNYINSNITNTSNTLSAPFSSSTATLIPTSSKNMKKRKLGTSAQLGSPRGHRRYNSDVLNMNLPTNVMTNFNNNNTNNNQLISSSSSSIHNFQLPTTLNHPTTNNNPNIVTTNTTGGFNMLHYQNNNLPSTQKSIFTQNNTNKNNNTTSTNSSNTNPSLQENTGTTTSVGNNNNVNTTATSSNTSNHDSARNSIHSLPMYSHTNRSQSQMHSQSQQNLQYQQPLTNNEMLQVNNNNQNPNTRSYPIMLIPPNNIEKKDINFNNKPNSNNNNGTNQNFNTIPNVNTNQSNVSYFNIQNQSTANHSNFLQPPNQQQAQNSYQLPQLSPFRNNTNIIHSGVMVNNNTGNNISQFTSNVSNSQNTYIRNGHRRTQSAIISTKQMLESPQRLNSQKQVNFLIHTPKHPPPT